MSRKLTLIVAVAATLALAPPAVQAAAGTVGVTVSTGQQTSRLVVHDDTGDVWSSSLGLGDDKYYQSSSPAADVTRMVAVHGARRLRISMAYQDLRRRGSYRVAAKVEVMPPNEPWAYYLVGAWSGPKNRRGDHVLAEEVWEAPNRCKGLRHRFDYGVDRVTISIPRRCINNPWWLRLRTESTWSKWFPRWEVTEFYDDNPHGYRLAYLYDAPFSRRLYPRS